MPERSEIREALRCSIVFTEPMLIVAFIVGPDRASHVGHVGNKGRREISGLIEQHGSVNEHECLVPIATRSNTHPPFAHLFTYTHSSLFERGIMPPFPPAMAAALAAEPPSPTTSGFSSPEIVPLPTSESDIQAEAAERAIYLHAKLAQIRQAYVLEKDGVLPPLAVPKPPSLEVYSTGPAQSSAAVSAAPGQPMAVSSRSTPRVAIRANLLYAHTGYRTQRQHERMVVRFPPR